MSGRLEDFDKGYDAGYAAAKQDAARAAGPPETLTTVEPCIDCAADVTPKTESGRAFLESRERYELWHPIDGRRDLLTAEVVQIEQEAASKAVAEVREDALLLADAVIGGSGYKPHREAAARVRRALIASDRNP